MNLEVQVPGKWILAGEHTVLRGSPALVFPLRSRFLDLSYDSSLKQPLQLELQGEHGKELEVLLWGVLEKACEKTQMSRSELQGKLKLKSNIPLGAGLGASAALCVAIGRWFQALGKISQAEVYEFSRSLENLFHGESSGVDIAVALSGEGLRFMRNGSREKIQMNWKPKWFVSYSGKRGVTSDCVNQVKSLLQQNSALGEKIDEDMKKAVQIAEEALVLDQAQGLAKMKESMDLAKSCFDRWGLTPEEHVQWLISQGAYAVKPTGSGGGGFVLSLWRHDPPVEATKLLIACL